MEPRRALAMIMILAGLFMVPILTLDALTDDLVYDGRWHTYDFGDDSGNWHIEWDFDESAQDRFTHIFDDIEGLDNLDETIEIRLSGIFDDLDDNIEIHVSGTFDD